MNELSKECQELNMADIIENTRPIYLSTSDCNAVWIVSTYVSNTYLF